MKDRRKKTPVTGSKEKSRKKKQIVRKDKPRGRKPKGKAAAKTKANARAASRPELELADSEDNEYCAGCGEHISVTVCDWLQCRRCQLWYDIECAGMVGKAKTIQDQFVCDQCN